MSVVHATSGSATIASHTYTYRADGRKTGETTADGSVVSYGYDAAGQLTSESKVSSANATLYSLSYTYDAAGNRASKTAGGNTETYLYDSANKLTTAGAKSYTYDNAGNVQSVTNSTTGVTTNLAWDGESRMTAIDNGTAGTVNASYVYNGLDQRTGRVDSASTTYAYTRASDAIDAPVLSDGQATYTQGNGLISEVRGSASKFYKADGIGTTRALTSTSGTTTDTLSTDAFGNTTASSGTSPSPFGFVGGAGYQTDSDTGLMLLGHRYYDPSTGRFLSRDPIRAGYNWYIYCDNDPGNTADPQGLKPPEPIDDLHPGLDHFVDGTGTPRSIGIDKLPTPTIDGGIPSARNAITGGKDGIYPINDDNIPINFGDKLIGRAIGHVIGTVTIKDGKYSIDAKLYVHPDVYDFNNDPSRGFGGNLITGIVRNVHPEGVGYTIFVLGYDPIHERGNLK